MGIALAHVGTAFHAEALISHPAQGHTLHSIHRFHPDATNKVRRFPLPLRCRRYWSRAGALRCRQTLMEG